MADLPITQQVTFLTCRDLDAASAFYGGVLGLPLVLDQGPCRIYRAAGEAFVGICLAGARPVATEGVILTLVTPEVDSWYQELARREVTLEGPPAVNPTYNIYNFFARDPDGHLVEFQKFLDPAWPEPGRTEEG